jgi:hypothetical protein
LKARASLGADHVAIAAAIMTPAANLGILPLLKSLIWVARRLNQRPLGCCNISGCFSENGLIWSIAWLGFAGRLGASESCSFDHLVGAAKQWNWDGQSERSCGFEVDDQFELGRLLHG